MSKRHTELKKTAGVLQATNIENAAQVIKNGATAKFDETIELHMRLGVDPKKSDQQVRATAVLPHGTGKKIRVAAFVEPARETEAKEAGADIIGTEEVIEQINKKGIIDFDVAVATPTMMAKLAKAARVLGPRGMMPNPKEDTVGTNVEKMIKDQKGGKVSFKNDNTSNMHVTVGKASFTEQQIAENISAIVEAVKKVRPSSAKGIYIKSAFVSSTMGPSVELDTSTL
ncbi:50S ribosomal protein L1 [Patescibacteria group bacterium]|nr:50S ribosomal protein L1 [Patescibacteria group bacterium]